MHVSAILVPLAALFLFVRPSAVLAQDPPIRWGHIPQEHLEMRDFPADTNAAAVILADYGTVTFDHQYAPTLKRHRRIKILSEAGFEWGTFSVVYLAEDRMERVRGVRGQTFLLREDGEVERHKLGRRDIFDEDVDGSYRRTRFTLPALAVGAVIEYQYEVRADNAYLMPGWTFQSSEPTLWSEFRPEIPRRLHFVMASRGMTRPLDIEESTEVLDPSKSAHLHRWVLRDVPALREEPFMTTPNDYLAAIDLQLSGFVDPIHGLRKILHTWDKAADDLRDLPRLKQFFNPPRAVREQARSVVQGVDTPAEKVRAIYDFVRSSIEWSGWKRLIPDQEIDDILASKKGSSADIAVLLGAMLREAGLEANPVFLSTRSHGMVMEIYPLISQFNYLIVHVNDGQTEYLLDATDPLRPMELLPLEVLNGRGWMVTREGEGWIDVASSGRYMHEMYIEANVEPSGALRAIMHATDRGYSALEGRKTLQESDDSEFVRDVLLDGTEAAEIGTFVIEGRDSNHPALVSRGEVVFPAYAQAAGEMIYFNPKILGRIDKNPFRLAERTFPVDYGYPSAWAYSFHFKPPEGYEVEELPSNIRLRLKSGGGTYVRMATEENGRHVIQSRFEISRSVIEPAEYGELRALYERIIALEAEQVVLRRTDDAEAQSGGR